MTIKLGDAGTIDHFGLAFQYQTKKIIKKIRKIKILYKCIQVPYGSICCTQPTNLNTHLLTSQKTQLNQEPHKRAHLSENGGLGKKKSGEWAKSRKG